MVSLSMQCPSYLTADIRIFKMRNCKQDAFYLTSNHFRSPSQHRQTLIQEPERCSKTTSKEHYSCAICALFEAKLNGTTPSSEEDPATLKFVERSEMIKGCRSNCVEMMKLFCGGVFM